MAKSNEIFDYLKDTAQVNTLFLVISVFLLITLSYILGLLCHEMYSLVNKKIQKNKKIKKVKSFEYLIENLFNKKSCVDSQKKRERYARLAETIFKQNDIPYSKCGDKSSDIEWSYELSNYFFTYCLYQLQIRGLNRKTEKLRDIEGLAKSFCASIILLLAVLLMTGAINWNTFSLPKWLFLFEVLLLIAISWIPESVKFIFDNRLEVLQISHLPTLHIVVTASPAG